jgi:hypothetical protein
MRVAWQVDDVGLQITAPLYSTPHLQSQRSRWHRSDGAAQSPPAMVLRSRRIWTLRLLHYGSLSRNDQRSVDLNQLPLHQRFVAIEFVCDAGQDGLPCKYCAKTLPLAALPIPRTAAFCQSSSIKPGLKGCAERDFAYLPGAVPGSISNRPRRDLCTMCRLDI